MKEKFGHGQARLSKAIAVISLVNLWLLNPSPDHIALVSVKLCEYCANNEIVECCDVVVGHVGGAVGRGSGGATGWCAGDATGPRAYDPASLRMTYRSWAKKQETWLELLIDVLNRNYCKAYNNGVCSIPSQPLK
ncbi:unnamed protein product [Spodoptera exigua]|nr:unnamed protein product [Spodoptera exigua]